MSQMTEQKSQSVRELVADIVGGAVSVVKGHMITWRTFWRKKVTDQYPHKDSEKAWKPHPGYRGDFALISDAERPGNLRCIACMQCARVCPVGCIHIEGEGKGKERRPSAFYIDIGLCMYCWMCVETCPVAAITMTTDYNNVSFTPQGLIRDMADLQKRGEGLSEPLYAVPPASADEDAPANE